MRIRKTATVITEYRRQLILLFSLLVISWQSAAQCPTVNEAIQNFCDIESILISDLSVIDNGGGVNWYDTASSTTPLILSDGLENGEDYYASSADGSCATRQRVDVIITGPPLGQNFQGICLDDPNQARISDLVAMGNDVQWYNTATGGGPLPNNASLVDDKIYYADQANPVTGCRSSRLAVLVNVGNIPIPTGSGLQKFCYSSEVPTVADLEASGENNWYSSISSAVILDPTTPLVNGASYYATTIDPPCESDERLKVIVQLESINSGINGILDICENQSPVDLFTLLGGSPTPGGTWSPTLNSGTGIFDPTMDPSGTYTYTISGNICSEVRSTVTVTVSRQANAGTGGSLQLCTNSTDLIDLFSVLSGLPDPDGNWTPSLNSGTGIFDPSIDPAGIYTYFVEGNACEDASATIVISIEPLPDAGSDGELNICESDTNQINLFNSLNGNPQTGGTWTPALDSNSDIFDPLKDAAGIYTYTVSGNGICPDATASVLVTIFPEPNTGTDGSLSICSTETELINLFTLLEGSPDPGGTWSPALNSGTGIFNPQIDSAGIYTYSISGNVICPDASSRVTVTIQSEPDAGTDGDLNICSSNTTVVDLFNALEGSPDAGGFWSPSLNSGTGLFDPNTDTQGTYTYTISGNGICPDASAKVNVTIYDDPNAGVGTAITICENDLNSIDLFSLLGNTADEGGTWSPQLASGSGLFDPSLDSDGIYTYIVTGNMVCPDATASVTVTFASQPNAGLDGTLEVCESQTNAVDLFNYLNGAPDPGGSWTPSLNSGTGIFDPNIDAPGTYTYTLNAESECTDDSASVIVSIFKAPSAGTSNSISLCENDPNTIDLFSLLNGTPDSGGTWLPSLSSGSGIFDPKLDTEGDYVYTVIGNEICTDASATISVTIIPQPDAGTDGALTLCSTDTSSVDLFNSLNGTPDTGGTWTPALNSGTGIFDPAIDSAGIYTYSFPGTSGCSISEAEVTVDISTAPNAGNGGTYNICEGDTTTIDLFSLLSGNPDTGGNWQPTLASGTGVFDPSLDNEATYTYTVAANENCPEDITSITITFIPQLNAGTDGSLEVCQNDSTNIDLFTILNGTPDPGGTWSPSLSSGTGIFDPTLDSAGIYNYSFSGNSTCGHSSAAVEITFIQQPSAGSSASTSLCINDTNPIDLFNILGGNPDTGGSWSPSLASGTGIFDPNVDTPGTYTYGFTDGPCNNVSATVTVTQASAPNAGIDGFINLCNNGGGTVDLFDYLGPDAQTGGTWIPALLSNTGIFDLDLDAPGVYTYRVGPDACDLVDNAKVSVVVFSAPDVSGLTIAEDTSICLGNTVTVEVNGANQLEDGDYTVRYELVGTNNASKFMILKMNDGTGSFEVPAEQLTELGISTLSITGFYFPDGSCSSDTSSINSIEILVEDAPPPTLISEGHIFCELDEPTLAELNDRIIESTTVTWYDADVDGNIIALDTVLNDGTTYYATLVGDNGCESSVRLAVTISFIECLKELIIPDGFSPNDDGVNDDFHIVNLNELYPNFRLKVFNRYGNILYEGDRNTPRWDGHSNRGNTMGNSEVPSGVYFYILDFNDGQQKSKQGRVYLNR